MLATLSGARGSIRIARPRIWLEGMNEAVLLASTRLLSAGASQPSPSSAWVPTSTRIVPSVNSAVTSRTSGAVSSPVPSIRT